jgi:hypothetical protein
MIDTRPIPHAMQTFPGEPIYLRTGNDAPRLISDSQALFLAHQLIQFVLGNDQARARVKHGD